MSKDVLIIPSSGDVRFYEFAASGSNYVGFRAPDSIPSDRIWVLPSSDGVSNQLLATDGAGTLYWKTDTAGGGGSGINPQLDNTQDAIHYPVFVSASGSDITSEISNEFTYNPSKGRLGIGFIPSLSGKLHIKDSGMAVSFGNYQSALFAETAGKPSLILKLTSDDNTPTYNDYWELINTKIETNITKKLEIPYYLYNVYGVTNSLVVDMPSGAVSYVGFRNDIQENAPERYGGYLFDWPTIIGISNNLTFKGSQNVYGITSSVSPYTSTFPSGARILNGISLSTAPSIETAENIGFNASILTKYNNQRRDNPFQINSAYRGIIRDIYEGFNSFNNPTASGNNICGIDLYLGSSASIVASSVAYGSRIRMMIPSGYEDSSYGYYFDGYDPSIPYSLTNYSTLNRVKATYGIYINNEQKNYLSSRLGINELSPQAVFHVKPTGVTVTGVIIQGAASQTADLQQWQNSIGTALARVNAAGSISGVASGIFSRLNVTSSTSSTTDRLVYIADAGLKTVATTNVQIVDTSTHSSALGKTLLSISKTGANSGNIFGVISSLLADNNGSSASMVGFQANLNNNTTGSAKGFVATIENAANMYGSQYDIQGLSDFSNMYGCDINLVSEAFYAGSPNLYGIKINVDDSSAEGSSNVYGAYIQAFSNQSNGNLVYGIYCIANDNYFAGNVGINTTIPNALLTVKGNGASTEVSKIYGFVNQTADLTQWLSSSSGVLARVTAAGSISGVGSGLFMEKVGVGVSNPTAKLQVNHSSVSGIAIFGNHDRNLYIQNDATATGILLQHQGQNTFEVVSTGTVFINKSSTVALKSLAFYDPFSNGYQYNGFGSTSGSLNALRYNVAASNFDHVFFRGDNSGSSTELMRIRGNRTVGINTSSPVAMLHITPTGATATGVIVRGVASQTADLLQVQNSAATPLVRIDAAGSVSGVASGIFKNIIAESTLNVPISTTLALTSNGTIGIDSSVTDWSHGILKYYSGEELGVVAMPIAEFTGPSGEGIVKYNSTLDEFRLVPETVFKSLTVESPVSGDDITMFYTNGNWTIGKMVSVLVGSGSPSVTWTIRKASDRSASGVEVVTGGVTTTNTASGTQTSSFNSATIANGDWVWLETTAKSGTVNQLHVTVVMSRTS